MPPESKRRDIVLAIPAAGFLFFGAAALLEAYYHPEHLAALWIGAIGVPLGLVNLVMLLIWEMSDPVLRERRPKVGPAIIANLAIAMLAIAIMWHFSDSLIPKSKSENKSTATASELKFPTVAELFKSDFPQFFKISSEMTTKVGIAPPVNFTAQVYKDLEAQSMFLGIYIPASPFTFSACLGIAHDYEKILKEAENAVIIYTRPGEHVPNTSRNLKFSGRIYIYHEQELSVREIADLVDIFKSRNLSVQFRGMSYASEVFRDRLLREKK